MRTTPPFFSQYRLHMYMFSKYTTKTCTCQCKKEYRMIKVYISFSLFYYAYIEVLQTRKTSILIGNIQLFKFSAIIISKHKYPEQTKKIRFYNEYSKQAHSYIYIQQTCYTILKKAYVKIVKKAKYIPK